MFDYSFLDACGKPKAIIQAENDEYGPRAAIEPAFARMAAPKHLTIVDGATHLYPQHLAELEAAAAAAAAWLLAAKSA
jgi:hypothetical protein